LGLTQTFAAAAARGRAEVKFFDLVHLIHTVLGEHLGMQADSVMLVESMRIGRGLAFLHLFK
jgi:hypothetical protein